MRKSLHKFEHSWQAEIVQDLLKNEGIQSFNIRGAREYAAIVTGIGQASSELFVDEVDQSQAQDILNRYFAQTKFQLIDTEDLNAREHELAEESKQIAIQKSKDRFRTIIFLSCAAVFILPVIVNVFATMNYFSFLRQSPSLSRLIAATTALILGWCGAAFLVHQIFTA